MAGTSVTIAGSTYYVPTNGQDPSWGADLHDTVVALANSVGSANLATTSFTLLNNQASPTNVTGAAWSTATTRSVMVNFSIYITTTLEEYTESGTLYLNYKSTAGTWDLSRVGSGSDSGIVFSVTSGGQLQYVSPNATGSSYSGKLKYTTQVFLQA